MQATGAFPTADLALAFDSGRLVCDLQVVDGDLALDDTPVTPLLVALGSDRRAAPDDTLPGGITPLNRPVTWLNRRGWCGDALDRAGRLIGSRLWLLDREKASDDVLRRAEFYVAEAAAWLKAEYGITPETEVAIDRRNAVTPWLKIRVSVDGRSVSLLRKLS